jgi:hypothetical protein
MGAGIYGDGKRLILIGTETFIFTDKETVNVIYAAQVSHGTTGGIFGGSSFDGVGGRIPSIIKRKK